jgi:Xaa-Pro aminopeptidase
MFKTTKQSAVNSTRNKKPTFKRTLKKNKKLNSALINKNVSFSTHLSQDQTSTRSKNDQKLVTLRKKLQEDNIDALFIPLSDPHLSEYVPEHDKRLEYISGFSGSAGTAVVTQTEALLWTDSRYYLQANQQLSPSWTLMKSGLTETPTVLQWAKKNLKKGQSLGFDAWNISMRQSAAFQSELASSNIKILKTLKNPVDAIWAQEQPPLPFNKIRSHEQYSGEGMASKLTRIRQRMEASSAKALVLCALDEIAWVTNLRGSDVDFNPVFLSYAVITHDEFHLFVDLEAYKSSGINLDTNGTKVVLHPYTEIGNYIKEIDLGSETIDGEAKLNKIWLDNDKTNSALLDLLPQDASKKAIITEPNPIGVMKAIKNKVEISNMKKAHIRDAVAVVRFLSWFEQQFDKLPNTNEITTNPPSSSPQTITTFNTTTKLPLNEYTLSLHLNSFRQQEDAYMGPSFDTISSIGPNGAIIHYKPDETNSAIITPGQIFLLDSGAQFGSATTDITRTFYIPCKTTRPLPNEFEKEVFTRVLQGHIGIATAIWPQNTSGPVLDILARAPLWNIGLDCVHGIGHGVGAGLNVHEGPISISKPNKNSQALSVPLVEGMILSNEPGYYHDGEFGIRIENLVNVVEKETKFGAGKSCKYFGFENLTMVPLDRRMINTDLMSKSEIKYVDDYHQEVRAVLKPLIGDTIVLDWLIRATEPL